MTDMITGGLQKASPRKTPVSLLMLAIVAMTVLRAGSCLQVERPYKAPSSAELLAELKKRGLLVRSVRAETRMGHQSPQGKIKATVRLMAARGGKLRLDAVSPMDTPISTLVTDGKSFALVDAKANRHYHGPAKPCALARFTGIELAPDVVLTVLGGATPLIPYRSAKLRWDDRAGQEVLTLIGPDRQQTIRLVGNKPRWDLVDSEIRDNKGQVLLHVVASDHRSVGGIRAPRKLSITQPDRDRELDVVFKKLELNKSLPTVAFELPTADGLPSERVDCAP